MQINNKGVINGIWLTNNGKLHYKVIPNLGGLVPDALLNNFEVVLWTNIKDVNETEITQLSKQGIIVKDYSECSKSIFYKYFLNFFEKGMQGDKAAFALASDILRMSILELFPDDKFYIYTDPNDVTFPYFSQSLAQLEENMSNNALGFSFYVNPIDGYTGAFHLRNDVLIAKKELNPQFFADYLQAYAKHLDLTANNYFKPQTDKEAQDLARQISNQTAGNFFQVVLMEPMPIIKTDFGFYIEFYPLVNCLSYFPYERHMEDANTWLPSGLLLEEREEMKDMYPKSNCYADFMDNYLSESRDYFVDPLEKKEEMKNIHSRRHLDFIYDYVMEELNYPFSSSFLLDFTKIVVQELVETFQMQISINQLKLTAPEKKLITLPGWEEVKKSIENPSPKATLAFPVSFFSKAYKDYLIEHRHDNAQLQREYDYQYGLVKK